LAKSLEKQKSSGRPEPSDSFSATTVLSFGFWTALGSGPSEAKTYGNRMKVLCFVSTDSTFPPSPCIQPQPESVCSGFTSSIRSTATHQHQQGLTEQKCDGQPTCIPNLASLSRTRPVLASAAINLISNHPALSKKSSARFLCLLDSQLLRSRVRDCHVLALKDLGLLDDRSRQCISAVCRAYRSD
jgi:hypothetical protein